MHTIFKVLRAAIVVLALCVIQPGSVHAATYVFHADDTTIEFKVKNLWFSIKGELDLVSGYFIVDSRTLNMQSALVVMDALSLNTKDKERDKSLHSREFFDTSNHPIIVFESEDIALDLISPAHEIDGVLSIKGSSNPFNITIENAMDMIHNADGLPDTIQGTATGKLNRLDYNVGNDISDFVLSEDVLITIEFTASRNDNYFQQRKPLIQRN